MKNMTKVLCVLATIVIISNINYDNSPKKTVSADLDNEVYAWNPNQQRGVIDYNSVPIDTNVDTNDKQTDPTVIPEEPTPDPKPVTPEEPEPTTTPEPTTSPSPQPEVKHIRPDRDKDRIPEPTAEVFVNPTPKSPAQTEPGSSPEPVMDSEPSPSDEPNTTDEIGNKIIEIFVKRDKLGTDTKTKDSVIISGKDEEKTNSETKTKKKKVEEKHKYYSDDKDIISPQTSVGGIDGNIGALVLFAEILNLIYKKRN